MTDPIDTKARELLDKALRDLGLHEDAYHIGCGADLDRNDQAAVNAISAALRTAPEGYVLMPLVPTDKMLDSLFGRDLRDSHDDALRKAYDAVIAAAMEGR